MTQDEAIINIIGETKFYIGKLPQSTASNFVASWRRGQLKQKTIDSFLGKFGYVKIHEAQWRQLDGKPKNLKTK